MTIEERERLLRLQQAELHGAMPETPGIEVDVTHTECCGTLLETHYFNAQIMPHYYTGKPALSVKTHPHEMQMKLVDELIALLQKAKALMQGGE